MRPLPLLTALTQILTAAIRQQILHELEKIQTSQQHQSHRKHSTPLPYASDAASALLGLSGTPLFYPDNAYRELVVAGDVRLAGNPSPLVCVLVHHHYTRATKDVAASNDHAARVLQRFHHAVVVRCTIAYLPPSARQREGNPLAANELGNIYSCKCDVLARRDVGSLRTAVLPLPGLDAGAGAGLGRGQSNSVEGHPGLQYLMRGRDLQDKGGLRVRVPGLLSERLQFTIHVPHDVLQRALNMAALQQRLADEITRTNQQGSSTINTKPFDSKRQLKQQDSKGFAKDRKSFHTFASATRSQTFPACSNGVVFAVKKHSPLSADVGKLSVQGLYKFWAMGQTCLRFMRRRG